ncbi:MAG: ABC transporter substrate-binding protein, partial [Chloroflexota bacterium]|nr:ABC transporter substrate-binding protein [Chloroflexota bacterium]
QWLYDGLYTYDASLTPVPSLAAAEADISEDGLTWTVSLVENAMFMPGEIPLTAADVVFTYEMANSPNCRFNPSICLAFITVTPEGAEEPVPVLQNVEALDDYTVEFTLASPYAPFATTVLPMFIIPQSATEESFARFEEGAENVAADEIADLQTRIAEDAGTDEEPNPDANPVQFRAEIEAILTAAGLELPDQALYPALDETTGEPIEGQLDEGAYTGALITQLGDLATTLESEAADQLAAAYPLLDIQRNPVGAGPFYMTEFSPGTSLTYAANPNYHKGEPQISTMNLPIIKNTTALGTSLLAGDVDWIYTVAPDVLPQVQEDPNVQIAEYADFGYFGLQFNLREGQLFAEREVRQAIAHCIEKDEIVAVATDGQGVPIYADIPPASWAYNPDVPQYEFNVEMANQMLDDAGWLPGADGVREKDGQRMSTNILVRAGQPQRIDFMALVRDQLNQNCGFEITTEEVDFATVLLPGLEWPHVFPGTEGMWDAYFGGWGTGFDPDPYALWHSSQCTTPEQTGTFNYVCFQNDEADELIEAGLVELDQDARAEIYQEFELIMAEELPYLWAWSDIAREGLRSTIASTAGELQLDTPTFYWEIEKLTNQAQQ